MLSAPKDARARFAPLVAHVAREWRRAVDGRLQIYGLTEATWLPLLRIARSETPMRQNELAASLSLDGSSVVRLIDTLENSGLVERCEDRADRRAKSLADGLARLAPGGVDVVIDALGGPLTGQAVAGLARGGRVVVMGYAAGTETTMRVTDLVWKLAHVSGFSLFAASAEEQATAYAAVLPLVAGGQVVPAHDRSFPLEQAPEALRHLIEDRPFGTVTLTVGGY